MAKNYRLGRPLGDGQRYLYQGPTTTATSQIDLETLQSIPITGSVGFSSPSDIAVSPDGRYVYLTSFLSHQVLIGPIGSIQGNTNPFGSITLPSPSNTVVFSPI